MLEICCAVQTSLNHHHPPRRREAQKNARTLAAWRMHGPRIFTLCTLSANTRVNSGCFQGETESDHTDCCSLLYSMPRFHHSCTARTVYSAARTHFNIDLGFEVLLCSSMRTCLRTCLRTPDPGLLSMHANMLMRTLASECAFGQCTYRINQ